MQNIEPFYAWRDRYIAAKDKKSPFHGRVYSEFHYTNTIYNHYIHPQWDHFGSSTLYMKILFTDYNKEFAILEFIGEWNDALYNDVMFLKREVIDPMIDAGIHKFLVIGENVLNFHGSDNCYYEEWWDDVKEEDGWIVFINLRDHVVEEMQDTQIQYYVNFGHHLEEVNWRPHKPKLIYEAIEALVNGQIKQLRF
jgi:hypothetical protein